MVTLTIQTKDNGLIFSSHPSRDAALTALDEQRVIGEENPEETVFNWWVVDESPTEEEQFAAHAESLGEDLATFMGW